MDYQQAYKSEGYGGVFDIGIDIHVAAPHGVTEEIARAARKAADILEQAITRDYYANSREAKARVAAERAQLLACFPPSSVYVRPIPNGYCDRACCEHRPWYEVTTSVGPVRIGWRKRVIAIDWSGSAVEAEASALFPSEDVTKVGRMIHAWGYEKAREYLAVLIARPTLQEVVSDERSESLS